MYEYCLLRRHFDEHPESIQYIPALAKGLNSPMFKQVDFMATELAYGVMGTVAVGGLGKSIFRQSSNAVGALPKVRGHVTQFAQTNLDQITTSTRNYSARVNNAFQGQEAWLKQTTKQLEDIAEAATEQMGKGADGLKNAFVKGTETDGILKSTYGAYKNGSAMLGQGYTKARDGIRQVMNDWDEIRPVSYTHLRAHET